MAKKGTFARGNKARAHRDVIARDLEKSGVPNPYAVATDMVKRGVRSRKTAEVDKEFEEQKHSKEMNEKGYSQNKGNPSKFHKKK